MVLVTHDTCSSTSPRHGALVRGDGWTLQLVPFQASIRSALPCTPDATHVVEVRQLTPVSAALFSAGVAEICHVPPVHSSANPCEPGPAEPPTAMHCVVVGQEMACKTVMAWPRAFSADCKVQ